MDSSTSRAEEERQRQEDLRRQIAELQSQLKEIPQDIPSTPSPSPLSPKRKRIDTNLLVPPTPSPKKRKLDHQKAGGPHKPVAKQGAHHHDRSRTACGATPAKAALDKQIAKLPASNLLNKLVHMNRRQEPMDSATAVTRSSGFSERPPPQTTHHEDGDTSGEPSTSKRDERLALIEDLEPGPIDHTPPSDDPDFDNLEPNSGIRLSSRSVSHEDLQDHLRGRFYLSPSRLYSAVRLLPDKQAYDVPVAGDWITIAVVAERGDMKYSRAPVAVGQVEGEEVEAKAQWKGKAKAKEESSKPTGKKYVNIKLIDFGARAKSASSATGGKAVIRGDAFLSLLLFESDRFDLVTVDGERKPKKVYKGGSGGAFEAMAKIKEGDVVVLLNPRVLKPFQRSNDAPHPTNNVLAITPESAESIMTIGRARDLGMCSVMKKNDKLCGSWYDKRVSNVCEYHVQHAVERRRAARAEFSIGTTGMSTNSAPKRKPAYDPARQWGLKPVDAESGGSTYIVSGHIVNGSSKWESPYATDGIGREGQAKAKRKTHAKDADRALMGLLERDKAGMQAVMKAREVGQRDIVERRDKKETAKGKRESKATKKKLDAENEAEDLRLMPSKAGYSAEVIKQLGFDPVAKAGQGKARSNLEMQKKLESLEAVQSGRKEIILGPRPGPRIRSSVKAPQTRPSVAKEPGSSDDELPVDPLGKEDFNKETPMVDLDE